ncbi:hypothetical protein L3Y34_013683 [Caenorhabditis briggsae]|uniref:PH domain-containing protein n=1 Tax=Caenorhabditis briggsae TaxID=6238 RepID=A0AAE8ZVJ6_CAEBR|nr:hypothetical protein L3Y34_013683 [Caenorhabditis briggsae]
MAYGRKPIDIEDSFDYSSDERSSSPLATRLSEARQGVRDMIAKWNAQECARNSKLGKTPSSLTRLHSEDKVKKYKEERLERSWKSKNFNVKKSYFLDISEIQISPDTPEGGEVLEILSAVKSFSFYFEKKEEKTTWENAIRHSQEQASKRIGRKNLEQHMDLKLLKPIQVPKADAICSRCVGRAPLANTKYNQGNVCPDCNDKILEDCDAGTLFPDSITDVTKGKLRVKIGKKLRNPSSLFKKPQNFGLKKKNYEERKTDKIAADYVYIRDAKGAEKLRFVYIRKSDYTLRVFKSKYDSTIVGEAESLSPLVMELFKVEGNSDGWHFQLKCKLTTIEIRIEDAAIASDWDMSLGPHFKRKFY